MKTGWTVEQQLVIPGLVLRFIRNSRPSLAGMVTSSIWISLIRSSTLRELNPVVAFLLYFSKVTYRQ